MAVRRHGSGSLFAEESLPGVRFGEGDEPVHRHDVRFELCGIGFRRGGFLRGAERGEPRFRCGAELLASHGGGEQVRRLFFHIVHQFFVHETHLFLSLFLHYSPAAAAGEVRTGKCPGFLRVTGLTDGEEEGKIIYYMKH